jgi:diaminopimelate epimerase
LSSNRRAGVVQEDTELIGETVAEAEGVGAHQPMRCEARKERIAGHVSGSGENDGYSAYAGGNALRPSVWFGTKSI